MDQELLSKLESILSEFTPETIAEMSEEELEKLEELISRLSEE